MRISIVKKFLLTLVTLCFYAVANGQQQPDSLMQYLEIAAKNNPYLLQKFSEYQAALQKVPQVGSLPDPELNVGVFLSPMELIGGNQVADIRLMQMFPWFGVLKNAKDEMSLMAKAKYELFRDAKLQVFYDVQRTWYNLYRIQQDIHISEKNIEILRTLERLALVKFKSVSTGSTSASPTGGNMSNSNTQSSSSGSSGMNSMGGNSANNQSTNNTQPSMANGQSAMGSSAGGSGLADLYRIQIEIGELDNNISLLKSQQTTIIARFNTYLNRPVKTMVMIPDTLKSHSLGISLLAVPDSMLANNPMLDMLQYEQQSFDTRKKMVSRMSYPMIGIGVNYSLINKSDMSTSNMNGTDMIMPMVTVTLPIYRKKYKAMQTEADLMKSATEQGYTATANSLQTEYYEAMQLYQDAERRMKLYENQSQLAKKSLDIMIKSFSASSSGLTDILRLQQQTLDYEFKQVEALVDYNTSIAWLKRLMAFSQIQ
ncbi:MAG: TolC family protein [Salinivirgaceae bacterium]